MTPENASPATCHRLTRACGLALAILEAARCGAPGPEIAALVHARGRGAPADIERTADGAMIRLWGFTGQGTTLTGALTDWARATLAACGPAIPAACFLELHREAAPEAFAAALQAAVDLGGTWLRPDTARGTPDTHLHEIEVFGVAAFGDSFAEAARNWRRAATALVRGAAA